MSACPSKETLQQLQDGRLTEPQFKEIATHVEKCLGCQQSLDTMVKVPGELPAVKDPPLPSTSDEAPTSATLASKMPQLPGYEILEELGRGGMGVVWKARQVGLNRLVALKMIRSDRVVGPEQHARFRAEAEAVAQLQHPNIVQIYEIGEAAGEWYFSLEYVEGGSLADALRRDHWGLDHPDASRKAARLVATLADAVEHAHRRGIVHRDLKPANVLLATGVSAEGSAKLPQAHSIPKITDFGLARRLDDAAGLTKSGAILGTPAYMAPEQASGEPKQVGPHSDLYALGGILYVLLTGKAPHAASTSEQALVQAQVGTLVPPRRHNPRVAAALERICLRALSKEPQERHASAAELAQELLRWLDRPRRLRLWLAAAAALLVLTAVSAVSIWVTNRGTVSSGPTPAVALSSPPDLKELTIAVGRRGNDGHGVLGLQARKLVAGGVDQVQEALPPMTNRDAFRLYGILDRPAHWYLLWFDTEAKFEVNDAPPQRQAELTYPSDGTWQTVNSHDAKGIHLLVVVVSDRPPAEGKPELEQALGGLGRPPQELPRIWGMRGGGERVADGGEEISLGYLARVRRGLPVGFHALYSVWLQTK